MVSRSCVPALDKGTTIGFALRLAAKPMVGTVYMSPEPGAQPFVKAGAKVEEGQTLMIIEAMKVMNPIPAPRSGTVTEIFVTDAQPVEFDEPLLIIE